MLASTTEPGVPTCAVSAIVPCWNAADTITLCLNAILGSRVLPCEIICVDDGSQDDTVDRTRHVGDASPIPIRMLSLDERGGAAAARNHGAKHAVGTMLLFVDADVLIEPDVIYQLLCRLRETRAAAAVAVYRPCSAAQGRLAGFQAALVHHVFSTIDADESPYLGTQCTLVARHAFVAVGGFSCAYRGATVEDFELGARLRQSGARILLAPAAQITHMHRYRLRQFIGNYSAKSRGIGAIVRRLGWRAAGFGNGYTSASTLATYAVLALAPVGVFTAVLDRVWLLATALGFAGALGYTFCWRSFLALARERAGIRGAILFAALLVIVQSIGAVGFAVGLVLGD